MIIGEENAYRHALEPSERWMVESSIDMLTSRGHAIQMLSSHFFT